jgi:REP element-mobilizing transposase RayT
VLRSLLPDGVFHVTARGVARAPIFHDEEDYKLFRLQLLRNAEKFEWMLHAYCLMPNHYHLIVGAEQAKLSRGMQRLNAGYATAFNERHGRVGHVFQGRFASRVIDDGDHFDRAIAYVFDNPVAAGLCSEDGTWPWRDVSRV